MKRMIILLTILSLLVIQTACKNKEVVDKRVKEAQSTQHAAVNTDRVNNNDKDIYALIPKGWRVFEKVKGEHELVKGDLNKDGISDIVVIIERIEDTEKSPARALLIAFGNKDKKYTLSIIAEKAVLRADEGGVWGDPLESISIHRGSVVLSFYGGSNWRWYQTYKFRYQQNGWYLIGATLGSYFNVKVTRENADEEDYNLLTGDYIIKKTDENGKMITTKGNRGKRKLVNLRDFVVDSEEKQF